MKTFYRHGLAVLDPPNPINEDLHAHFEAMLKAMDAPPKSAAPVKRLPTPPKKTNKL